MDLPAPRALLWDKTSTPIDLGFGAGTATDGTRQVGTGFPPFSGSHAMLWSGTVASAIDAFGTDGTHQVGQGTTKDGDTHALLWSGTAASAVDLNPSEFQFVDTSTATGPLQSVLRILD